MIEKFILDVTAGYRVMWFNKNHPNVTYCDLKPECMPDVVTSYQDLTQFQDNSQRLVVFDPPHMIYTTKKGESFLKDKYGTLEKDWEVRFTKAFNEMWRVLMPYGTLLFKWNDNHISKKRVLSLFPVEPLVYQIVGGSRGLRNYRLCDKCDVCEHPCPKGNGPRSETAYFVFMKIPEEEKCGLENCGQHGNNRIQV